MPAAPPHSTNGSHRTTVATTDVKPFACDLVEGAVIGAMLVDAQSAYDCAARGLRPECFRGDRERQVATAIFSLVDSRVLFAAVAVWDEVQRLGLDVSYPDFCKLQDCVDATYEAPFLAGRLVDAHRRRWTAETLRAAARRAEDESEDLDELLTQVDGLRSIVSGSSSPLRPNLSGMLGLCDPKAPLRPTLFNGLCRISETMNLNAMSKVGKSWLIAYMALCNITGRPLFDRYETTRGEVLLIDNELHPETLNYRIRTVAAALDIQAKDFEPYLHAHCLRGKMVDIYQMEPFFRSIPKGKVNVVFLDAKYRFEKSGSSENDNNSQTQFYNQIDRYADALGAGFILNHHNSKGDQSSKEITDVGSGAGAQSRAADCHLVLRPHEEKNCAVMEAKVRSFPEPEPLVLRWVFPLWVPDESLDPAALKRPRGRREEKQEREDKDGIDKIVEVLRNESPLSASAIGRRAGMDPRRAGRLLGKMEDSIRREPAVVNGNETEVFSLTE